MKSAVFPPQPALRPYVQLLWYFESEGSLDLGPTERISPDGIVELVIHYRGGTAVAFPDQALESMPAIALVCQGVRYLDVRPRADAGFVSVRFRPWGALHFFDVPIDELSDRVVPADAVWAGEREGLSERLAEATCAPERVEIVESFLLARLVRFRKDDVEGAIRAVWRRGGDTRVPELCAELGVSERTAQRVFRRAVGMPPKRYARLVRFLGACSMIRSGGWRTLGEIGHRCGYYDQPHFDADFRSFSGLTPGEFAASSHVSFLEMD